MGLLSFLLVLTLALSTVLNVSAVFANTPWETRVNERGNVLHGIFDSQTGHMVEGRITHNANSYTEGVFDRNTGRLIQGVIYRFGHILEGTFDENGQLINGRYIWPSGRIAEGSFVNNGLFNGIDTSAEGIAYSIVNGQNVGRANSTNVTGNPTPTQPTNNANTSFIGTWFREVINHEDSRRFIYLEIRTDGTYSINIHDVNMAWSGEEVFVRHSVINGTYTINSRNNIVLSQEMGVPGGTLFSGEYAFIDNGFTIVMGTPRSGGTHTTSTGTRYNHASIRFFKADSTTQHLDFENELRSRIGINNGQPTTPSMPTPQPTIPPHTTPQPPSQPPTGGNNTAVINNINLEIESMELTVRNIESHLSGIRSTAVQAESINDNNFVRRFMNGYTNNLSTLASNHRRTVRPSVHTQQLHNEFLSALDNLVSTATRAANSYVIDRNVQSVNDSIDNAEAAFRQEFNRILAEYQQIITTLN